MFTNTAAHFLFSLLEKVQIKEWNVARQLFIGDVERKTRIKEKSNFSMQHPSENSFDFSHKCSFCE